MTRKPLSEETKALLALSQEDREKYIKGAEEHSHKELGIEITDSVDEDVHQSSSKLSIGPVLFDERTKNFVTVKYARKGDDYIYHISFTKKKMLPPQKAILYTMAKCASELTPDYIQGVLKPPERIKFQKETYSIECYTLIIKKVGALPGARKRMEDTLPGNLLNELDKLIKENYGSGA